MKRNSKSLGRRELAKHRAARAAAIRAQSDQRDFEQRDAKKERFLTAAAADAKADLAAGVDPARRYALTIQLA